MEPSQMLNMISQGAFTVKDGTVTCVNHPAACRMIEPGMSIAKLLHTGSEEYAALDTGKLYLTLCLEGHYFGASVLRLEDTDLFTLEEDRDQPQLQAYALAARELRIPLANGINAAQRLAADPAAAQLNQSLYQLLRVVGNMSDAARYAEQTLPRRIPMDVCALLWEILEKADALLQETGIRLQLHIPSERMLCPVDEEKLERAVYNMLSNAIKFSAPGDSIQVRLKRSGSRIALTVQDNGSGVPDELRHTMFSRYQRQPTLEDSRYGLGLGLFMIRSAAAAHEGTVLVEHPKAGGTRITLTLSTAAEAPELQSPLPAFDYAGELDHGLIELSQHLPSHLYQP